MLTTVGSLLTLVFPLMVTQSRVGLEAALRLVPTVLPLPQEAPNIPSPMTGQRPRGCTPRLRGPFLEKPSPRSPKGSNPTEVEGRKLRQREADSQPPLSSRKP